MWIGELGWGLKDDAEPLGEHSLDFAACMAQALICGKSVPGVEKFLWFTFSGCNEGGYEYGLVRGRPAYPLPAACAYAVAAYQLDDTQPVELVQPAADVWRASFRSDRREDLVVAWWSQGDPVLLRPPGDAPPYSRWLDSYGTALLPGDRGVSCGRLPVYWVLPLAAGARPEFLQRVQVVPPEPVALRSTYLPSTSQVALRLLEPARQAAVSADPGSGHAASRRASGWCRGADCHSAPGTATGAGGASRRVGRDPGRDHAAQNGTLRHTGSAPGTARGLPA
jgi:hypothetical protein